MVTRLYKERYQGFSVSHFHEFLELEHGLHRSYSWTKNVLARNALVKPAKRGGPHRLRRPRKPMKGVKEVIDKQGIFCPFYTDRGSHYFYTPEAGGKVDKSRLTQVGRALKQLNIKHIAAYSPQARGRSERMFGTLQGRI